MIEVLSRRRLIKSVFALASLSVIPGTSQALARDDVDRFMAMAKTGVVRQQEFLLRRPILLHGVSDLTITDCTFTRGYDSDETMMLIRNCHDLNVSGHFKMGGRRGYCIEIVDAVYDANFTIASDAKAEDYPRYPMDIEPNW